MARFQKIKNQRSKSTKVDNRFLILFQEEVILDKDPDWIIGIKQDKFFHWDNDNNEPMMFNAILPKTDFNKIKMWTKLCSYESNEMKSCPVYNVKSNYFDSFIAMLSKMNKFNKENKNENPNN